jgi:K+-transporting ATPase KdpF subunit
MPTPAGVSEREPRMVEPIIGLLVGVLLGVYLLYTLIYPEKF